MREKLNRFVDNLNGQFVEVSYQPAEYQCMDLCYNWIFCLDFPKSTIQHQYAYEVFTQATDFTREYFDIIPNTPEAVPQEGDLVVWNKTSSNVAGHIAIVIEATISKMKVFEQNNPLGSNAHIQDRGYTNCLGFLRPKFKDEDCIPQWLKTLFQESGLDYQNESKFREIWTELIRYDADDIKALQAQIVSVNEALSERAMEVSVLTEKNQKLSDKVAEVEAINNQLRSKNDSLDVEKTRLEMEVNKLSSEVDGLQKQVEALKSNKPLSGYSRWLRFKSLFWLR